MFNLLKKIPQDSGEVKLTSTPMDSKKMYSITERIKSIATGKKVPCVVCGEPLIAAHEQSGTLLGVKCPHGHEAWPLVNGVFPREQENIQKMIGSVAAGERVLCSVCSEPLMLVHTQRGTLAGVKCSNEHESYRLVEAL
jgi:hypothetical protein